MALRCQDAGIKIINNKITIRHGLGHPHSTKAADLQACTRVHAKISHLPLVHSSTLPFSHCLITRQLSRVIHQRKLTFSARRSGSEIHKDPIALLFLTKRARASRVVHRH
eukprot:scaffold7466_cov248-Pinguiococcus_pyrenoidosus.AAC.1